MLPGESFAAAVSASLDRLGPGWSVVSPGLGDGIPLDDAGSLLLRGPGVPGDDAATEVTVLTEALAVARTAVAAAVADAAQPAEGERALPTTLGGRAAWERACAQAVTAGAGVPDPHAVVVVRTDVPGDRGAERAAAALLRSVRGQDVVCVLAPGTYAVLALSCPDGQAAALAERLVAALLDVGVGAAAGAASDPDPRRAHGPAAARAREAWASRPVIHL